MRIQDHFKRIPAPLQRQILRRGLMGCAFLLLSLIFLLLGYDAVLVLPGFGFMLFCMGNSIPVQITHRFITLRRASA